MKTINYILKVPFGIIIVVLIYLNISLYSTQSYNDAKGYHEDVYAQLQHLKEEMHENNAGLEMQNFFPEGFVFQNALYGLTWCDLIQEGTDSSIKNEAIQEIDWTIKELLSDNGTYIFMDDLPVPFGVFYKGWTNLLIGKHLQLEYDSTFAALNQRFSMEIAYGFNTSVSPYLESYPKACWPCDNVIAAASLQINSARNGGKYDSTLSTWIGKVKKNLDENQLVPHGVEYKTGKSIDMGRGNSLSLGIYYLYDIDSAFAKDQFLKYKELFLDSRLGLPGVREHRMGRGGGGDVDSGPVIWGIGGAASIVGQRTMGRFGEWNTYEGLRSSIEAFGAAYTWGGKKKYVFGAMPMADAFIAWSNVSVKESQIKSGQLEVEVPIDFLRSLSPAYFLDS